MLAPALLFVLASTTPATPPLLIAAPPPSPPPTAVVEPPDSHAPVALLAGGLTGLLPLMVGSLLLAQDDRPTRQAAGVYVMVSGFALAPAVAHAASGSWRRALGFGAVSLALSAATIGAMHAIDVFDPSVANMRRVPFGVLLTAAFASAVVGVIAGELAPAPSPAPSTKATPEPPAARLSLWLAPAAAGLAWSKPL